MIIRGLIDLAVAGALREIVTAHPQEESRGVFAEDSSTIAAPAANLAA
jgi:hypothetical protein